MFSSRVLAAALVALVMTGVGVAEPVRPATKRLPEWLDALLRVTDTNSIPYESITLTVPEEVDAKSDQAKVEVISPEKFWRLAALVELRSGTADMKNLTVPGGPRRSAAEFQVSLDAPVIREGDIEKLRGAPEEIGALLAHLGGGGVHVSGLILSRPVEIAIFGKPVLRVPVRFALVGPRADVLSRVAEMAKPLPYAYLRGLKATPGTALEVQATVNLLVKVGEKGAAGADVAKEIAEKVSAAAGADVKVTSTGGDGVILAISGHAKDAAGARDAVKAIVGWPGLKGYDELGWKNEGGGVVMTGIVQF